MSMLNSYLQLHKEYLLDISKQSRSGKLNQFEVLHFDLYQWLQKEQELSVAQAKAVIEDSHIPREFA